MIPVTPFKQSDDSLCGPACIKMILDYYGAKDKYYCSLSEEVIATQCHHTYDLGCTNDRMVKTLKLYLENVFEVEDTTIKEIEFYINEGVPLIVDWFSGGCGHSSVVIDIDDTHITLIDPEPGEVIKMEREEFMRLWFDWENDDYISKDNLVARHMIAAYPKEFLK